MYINTMETKEQLMNGIKEWVQTDNELLKLKVSKYIVFINNIII